MRVFLTLTHRTHQRNVQMTASIEIPSHVHICPGMNLILTCNALPLRIPISDVDINAKDGSSVLRIKDDFESRNLLLNAKELEWFAGAPI